MIADLAPQLPRTAILVLVFVLATGLALAVATLARNRTRVRARLEAMTRGGVVASGGSLRGEQQSSAWHGLVNAIERSGLSLADTNSAALADKLAEAGFSSPLAPRIYTLVRLVATLGVPALFVLFATLTGRTGSLVQLYITGAALALAGLYIPTLIVRARADRRRDRLVRDFPDTLDLMLVCVEAGLGLEAAFDRVGREMMHSHPLVAKLLAGVVLELRAGRSREDALHRMGERARVDQIRSFVTLVIQSDRLGSSIGKTLRVYAAEMRERRRLSAEERAHRLPVLLSIPLVACMLPVMIGVLMLPAAIRVVRDLIPAMAGGG
ncbi:type II secretion system F family protein [Sphingomonas sp. MS122]|uniref:type II secretion system F family protein n=1 Tax=Sphingomonas sp. MS122 TaxID=3412683 RepID=UPI003C2EB248